VSPYGCHLATNSLIKETDKVPPNFTQTEVKDVRSQRAKIEKEKIETTQEHNSSVENGNEMDGKQ
jgi:hypothetical protein